MRLDEVTRTLVADLQTIGIDKQEALAEASLVLEHLTGWGAAQRLLRSAESLTDGQLERLAAITARRATREPLQYILGQAHFAGLTLSVREGVFIPRADTETLVEVALQYLAEKESCMIAEACTGSGAIALAVLAERVHDRAIVCERSSVAAACARENANRLGFSDRWQLEENDWLVWLEKIPDASVDVFLANPPYIPLRDKPTLAPEVANWEPAEALFGQDADGLDFYRQAARSTPALLKRNGLIALEIGDAYPEEALAIFAAPPWSNATLRHDLSGRPRVVSALLSA